MSSEIEETLERIKSHKGVSNIIICNSDGIPILPAKNENENNSYSIELSQLANKARSVIRDLDPTNDLTFLRIRTKKHEIMVAPDKDFLFIVVQNPNTANNEQ